MCIRDRGYSSGEAIDAIKEVAEKTLPRGFDIDWAVSYTHLDVYKRQLI